MSVGSKLYERWNSDVLKNLVGTYTAMTMAAILQIPQQSQGALSVVAEYNYHYPCTECGGYGRK